MAGLPFGQGNCGVDQPFRIPLHPWGSLCFGAYPLGVTTSRNTTRGSIIKTRSRVVKVVRESSNYTSFGVVICEKALLRHICKERCRCRKYDRKINSIVYFCKIR